jgi:hypothetical protein
LNSPIPKTRLDVLFQVAAKIPDPRIAAAGQASDLRTGNGQWRYYGINRKDWPIYSWIDDYVVKLIPQE